MAAPANWRRIEIPGPVPLVAGRTGSGPAPIVAIHGLSGDHTNFDAIAARLRHPGGMLAVDLRGRGESAKPILGYGMREHARDIIRMLDQEGIERATLVGHSMGGYVALEIARLYPDRVSGVVLLDSGFPRKLFPFLEPGAFSVLGDMAKILVRVARLSAAELNAVSQDSWLLGATGPMAHDLRKIRCPVALIRATNGFSPGSAPLVGDRAADSIRSCLRLTADVVVPRTNHYTLVLGADGAARVAKEIDRFQQQIQARDVGRTREVAA